MQRGNLIIYDPITGKIWSQTGTAEGDVLPHEYPEGLPYVEVPYEIAILNKVLSVDPETMEPVLELIQEEKTPAQIIAELQAKIAELEGGTP